LFSIGKVADKGYTTIFHPGNQGVMVHKEGTVTITTTTPADIQGWRAEMSLWEFDPTNNHYKPQKVSSLPAIPMAIRFLHSAAGYPTKTTWIAAIKNRNFTTWPL
jgi:hypothetical protein